MRPAQIQKIIRKRNYGFLRLIEQLQTEIQQTVLQEKDVREIVKSQGVGKESLTDVYQQLNTRINKYILKISELFKKVMVHGSKKVMDTKGNTLTFKTPKYEAQLAILVQNNVRLIKKITDQQREDIAQMLYYGVQDGKTYNEMAKDIATKVKVITEWKAKRIAVTEVSKAHAQAQYTVMKENDIKKYMWLTAGDATVCDSCKEYNRKTFPVSESSPLPVKNTHPNCRCAIVSVTGL